MSAYLLDTNIASDVIRGDRPQVLRRLTAVPMADVAVSSVTEGEILYGLAKRGRPPALGERVRQFLLRVDVLDWDRAAAAAYAELRSDCEKSGLSLSPLDLMIAAHAIAANVILVTRDKAFTRIAGPLRIEDWTT